MTRHVLVVDNEQEMVKLMQRHLEGEGFAVTPVHSGAEALAALARDEFDVVVTDLVGDAAGQTPRDGERRRVAQLLLEIERVLGLAQEILASGLKLRGHRIERLGHSTELVAPVDRQRRR